MIGQTIRLLRCIYASKMRGNRVLLNVIHPRNWRRSFSNMPLPLKFYGTVIPSLPIFSYCSLHLVNNEINEQKTAGRFLKSVKHGNTFEVLHYLKNGGDPNIRHELGWTALHVAAVNRQPRIVQMLLENGADPDIADDFVNIYQTAREKRIQSLDVMVSREEEFNANLNLRANFRGCTALHYAALVDDSESVRLLLEAGANPSSTNDYGRQPKDYARDPQIKKLLAKYCEVYEDIRKQQEVEERRKYPLEMRLKEHIVGQEGAITTVSSAIRRKENGWIDEEHPLVFLFLGKNESEAEIAAESE